MKHLPMTRMCPLYSVVMCLIVVASLKAWKCKLRQISICLCKKKTFYRRTGACPRCGEICSSESMHKLFGITFEYTDRTSDLRKQRDALNDNFCRKFYEIMCSKEEYSDAVKKSDDLKNQVEEIKQRNETVTANVDNLKATEASLKRRNSRLRRYVNFIVC